MTQLVHRGNGNLHTGFPLVPTSVTLTDLERRSSPYFRYFVDFNSFADRLRHNCWR